MASYSESGLKLRSRSGEQKVVSTEIVLWKAEAGEAEDVQKQRLNIF